MNVFVFVDAFYSLILCSVFAFVLYITLCRSVYVLLFFFFFFFKQKTAYEMRISDWSSDVCSSDLLEGHAALPADLRHPVERQPRRRDDRAAHEDGIGDPDVAEALHRLARALEIDVGPGGDVGLGGRPADAAGGRRLIARLGVGFLGSARAFRHRSSFHAAFGGTLAQDPQRPTAATFPRFPMFPAFTTRSSSRLSG